MECADIEIENRVGKVFQEQECDGGHDKGGHQKRDQPYPPHQRRFMQDKEKKPGKKERQDAYREEKERGTQQNTKCFHGTQVVQEGRLRNKKEPLHQNG